MNIEKDLRSLCWRVSAEALRGSVLASARRARVEQKFWRWTLATAAAVVAVAASINVSIETTSHRSNIARMELETVPLPQTLLGERLRERARLALSPPNVPRSIPEVPE
jgi:hypothetical protein